MGTFGCGLAGDLSLACRVKDTPTLRRNGNDCCQLSAVRDWLGRRTGWTTARTVSTVIGAHYVHSRVLVPGLLIIRRPAVRPPASAARRAVVPAPPDAREEAERSR